MSMQMHQGNDHRLRVTVVDDAGLPKQLEGAAIEWRLARSLTGPVVAVKTLGAGIETDAAPGVFIVRLDPADTAELTPGNYYHEALVTDASGDRVTVLSAWAIIKPALILPEE